MTGKPLDGEILPPEDGTDGDRKKVQDGFWSTLRRAASQIPFTHDLVAAYYCATDPASPFHVRATLFGALAYFVTPFDAVPDVLAGIGFTDDAAVLMGTISMVAAHITPAHRARAKTMLDQ